MERTTNPKQMDLTAHLAFAKVYPAIAEHIVKKYGITSGRCLDAGSGPGSLAIALAGITGLTICSLDKNPEMSKIAQKNINEAGLDKRISPVTADICEVPFDNDYFDIIVSRGSIFFWEDKVSGIKDLYRTLKPGGVLYCGGGMGNEDIMREADEIIMTDDRFSDMREFWQGRKTRRNGAETRDSFENILAEAEIQGNVVNECGGTWIEIIK
jgi:SAM-dependent methyltransferase